MGAIAALALQEVAVHFGSLTALDRVSLAIPPGDRRAIVGPNGAGKTTLFNIISGLLRPKTGRIQLFGQDITGTKPHERRRLGIARSFQLTSVFDNLTVTQNLQLAMLGLTHTSLFSLSLNSHARELPPEASRALELVGLQDLREKRASELGYGQRRQLEIALALAAPCRVLLLDEPTSGLPRGEARTFIKVLDRLPPDLTIVLIEHDMAVVREIAASVTVMHHGRIIAEGSPAQVSANPEVYAAYIRRR